MYTISFQKNSVSFDEKRKNVRPLSCRKHDETETKFVLGIVFEFLPSTSGSRNLKDSYRYDRHSKNLCRECKACPQILMNNASCPTYETIPFRGSSTIHTHDASMSCPDSSSHGEEYKIPYLSETMPSTIRHIHNSSNAVFSAPMYAHALTPVPDLLRLIWISPYNLLEL